MGRGRAPCCDKTKVRTGPWSPAEDLKLINFIRTHGHSNWRALPKQAGLLRCGKSCRLRWINYLRPDVKRGNFTPQEEETIIKLHNSIGNKWSKIASCLPGRTDNEIKNVWNTHLKKRLKSEVDCNRNNQGKDGKMDHSASSSCASSSITTCGDDNMEKLRGDNQVQEEKHEFMKLVSSKENAILESPTSSCTSNFSNTLIQENRPKQALVHSKPCESTIPQLGSLENGITDIPTDFDVDFWQILDSLDPLQSNETTQNGDTTVSNIDEKFGDGEVEFGKWVRFLENELGLTSDGDNQQIVITANSEGMSYEPEINTAFFDYSPIWPSSPPYYLDI